MGQDRDIGNPPLAHKDYDSQEDARLLCYYDVKKIAPDLWLGMDGRQRQVEG